MNKHSAMNKKRRELPTVFKPEKVKTVLES